ncbi:MAG: hypothetical protein K9H84_08590 [Bacteroidales bacterium]|nr:hypothetical protein [Bacteroidales bacterium]
MANRLQYKTIGIIGTGEGLCSDDLYLFGNKLGNLLDDRGISLVCGGLSGFMQADCECIQQVTEYKCCGTI